MSNRLIALLVGAVAVVGFLVYWFWPTPVTICALSNYKDETRHADWSIPDFFGDEVKTIRYLKQNWTPAQSMEFYTRTQGSRLLPYAWFLALEQPDNEKLFRDPAYMVRFGYLPQRKNECNPDALPVGFVKDPKRDGGLEDWLGLTCAACHTTQINYKGVGYRIDGAPTLADLQDFLKEMHRALKATLDPANDAKFRRFTSRVLPKNADPKDVADLKTRLQQVTEFREQYEARNKTEHPHGRARLDAFGRILNETLVRHLHVDEPAQARTPNAPASYPFLWGTPHHEVVQWNGIATNQILGSKSLGGLARNVGEVLGVFGEVDIPKQLGSQIGYSSSIRVPDLVLLEKLVATLQSPLWPDEFPQPDPEKAAAGKKTFAIYCAHCHEVVDRNKIDHFVAAKLSTLDQVRTDPTLARNFAMRVGKTGPLEGRKRNYLLGPELGVEAGGDEILLHTVIGVILNTPFNDYKESDLLKLRSYSLTNLADAGKLVYRSRPLNGIWATAPYLHNGSVSNLYELLLPAAERRQVFQVGRREFDPKHVGFIIEPRPGGYEFRVNDEHGSPIIGNSNLGHEYGVGKPLELGGDGLRRLTDDERWELVEYMKTL
jgi:hypothetical protein